MASTVNFKKSDKQIQNFIEIDFDISFDGNIVILYTYKLIYLNMTA